VRNAYTYTYYRLLDSYREFQNPASHRAVEQIRSPTPSLLPVTFPESYPFSLVAYLPNAPSRNSLSTKEDLFNPGLGETAIVFLVLILSSPRKHILNFLESSLEIEGQSHFAALLSQFFKVATSILQNDAFPSSWLNVNILAHKVLIKMMDPVSTLMERDFIPDQESEQSFDSNLWKEGFYMLLKLLSSEQLVIEEFSPQVRVLCLSRCIFAKLRVRNVAQSGGLLAMFVEKVPRSYCVYGRL
jgi:dedicator of cytokinesis protein 3